MLFNKLLAHWKCSTILILNHEFCEDSPSGFANGLACYEACHARGTGNDHQRWKGLVGQTCLSEPIFFTWGKGKKGETFEQAARRELLEEVGIEATALKLFGVYNNFYEHKKDTIVVFLAEVLQSKRARDVEIE